MKLKYFKFYRYLLPYWRKETTILILNGVIAVLGLANPYLSKLMIDKAYGNKDLRLFIILVAAGAILFVLNTTINAFSEHLGRYIRIRVGFDFNRLVFRRLQNLPYSFFQNTSSGKNLFLLNHDIGQVSSFITDVLPQAVFLIPRSLFILAIVFYLNPKMAAFSLLLMPFLYIVPLFFIKKINEATKKWIELSQNNFSVNEEVLSRMQLIKSFGKEKQEVRRYLKNLIKEIRFSLGNSRLEAMNFFANAIVNRVILGLIVLYGGYQIVKGNMTLGSLTAISIYLGQLAGLQGSFTGFFQGISLAQISFERLDTVLNSPAQAADSKDSLDVKYTAGNIEFKNATFYYKKEKMVLENLNFRIEGGRFVGMVGPSGCGKTTIINLILRLYHPLEGEVLIDGVNIKMTKSSSIYSQVGVALQQAFLWNASIKDNIAYSKPNASMEEIVASAKLAEADDFIRKLPQGYETIAGESGCRISEGQKQRIAIARAAIHKPRILLLDEALSSLDSATEDKVIENLRREFKGSTVIVVSHRMSTARKMDTICFLEHPRNIHIGTHDELTARNPKYRQLFSSQLIEFKEQDSYI